MTHTPHSLTVSLNYTKQPGKYAGYEESHLKGKGVFISLLSYIRDFYHIIYICVRVCKNEFTVYN